MVAVAFALPVLPGQEETIRRMSEQVSDSGSLRGAYEESRRSLGITEEKVWLQRTPIGEAVIVYWETDDPQHTLRASAFFVAVGVGFPRNLFRSNGCPQIAKEEPPIVSTTAMPRDLRALTPRSLGIQFT